MKNEPKKLQYKDYVKVDDNKDDVIDGLEGFESVAILAKRAQYRVTQRPIAYSVIGGIHNAGGKVCHLRFRIEIAEEMGWRLGDCIDIRLNRNTHQVMARKDNRRGYKLVATSKRNGISSYRISLRWQEDFGFPNVFSQVGCEIIRMIDGGVIFRICVEDDEIPYDTDYKIETTVDDGGVGFNPRTRANRIPS